MIATFLAFTMAACPATKMENKTEHEWNDFDIQTLKKAKKRCGQLYKNSPCVKVFRKRGEKDYSVICGGVK